MTDVQSDRPAHDHADDHRGEIEDHDRGLVFDLQTLSRRSALGLFGGAGLLALVSCTVGGSDGGSGSAGTTAAGTAAAGTTSAEPTATAPTATETTAPSTGETAATVTDYTEIPEETAGPYPGDGSNGPNVLDDSGIVRSDIRSSFGSSTTTATGVPLSVELNIFDSANGWAPLAGAAVYIWHCDMDGEYSMYSRGLENENYLRGVQETDSVGRVRFTTIFPGAYSGRWPHIHFEVYSSVADATSEGRIKATSQVALPEAACNAVYATAGYEQSVRNMTQTTLRSDNVFGNDGGIHQIPTYSGDVTRGYSVALNVGV